MGVVRLRFDTTRHYRFQRYRPLVVTHGVLGVQVHDARLVAVMNVYNVRRILTFNGRDFARYPSIRSVHPQELFKPASN